jgi:hypothetical protein
MQTLSWYMRRLQAMSLQEIAWRAQSAARGVTDRGRVALKLYPKVDGSTRPPRSRPAAPKWCSVPRGDWQALAPEDPASAWRARLIGRADRIAAQRLSFFDLDDVNLGDPIVWNRDCATGKRTPVGFAEAIDYRDISVTGDCKVVWEPNRHHQLVTLGRAYRATGDEKYARAVVEQIDSWIEQCPFGYGMNWRSPLELGVRLINWTWAIDLIADSPAMTAAFDARLLQSVTLHTWDIARKYSRGSSANNHRIGEAAGVFVATSYFSDVPDAARAGDESQRILCEEIQAQTYDSGATREQAFGYHLFVLHLFLAAGLAGRRSGRDFPSAFWLRLEQMFDYAGAIADGGPPPFYGDADDGYVLDLGDPIGDIGSLMQVGAAVFERPTRGGGSVVPSEAVHWLFGTTAQSRRAASLEIATGIELESAAVTDAGYYILQWGRQQSPDRVSVVFDCGELGFGSLAAHGHADALAIAVRAAGVDILVDPGTYDYFSFPEWRRYFRSTRAHNTVTIDGVDQSEQLGLFLWGHRASARCLDWRPRPGGGVAAGEHDGYRRLEAPATHRRRLDLDRSTRTLTIVDEIASGGAHDVDVSFHFGEQCDVRADGARLSITFPGGTSTLALDSRLTLSLIKAGEPEQGGWVSRGYHRKSAAWTARGTLRGVASATLTSTLTIGPLA